MKINPKDINIDDPDGQIQREVMNSFKTNQGDTIICKECGAQYVRGVWNFYNLCDSCFKAMDDKKMKERFDKLFGDKKEEI